MRWFVNLCHLIAAVLVSPFIVYSAITTGKYRRGWGERTGRVPVLPPLPRDRARIWFHAVSVGEVNAARGLVDAWRAQSPETEFVISTTTDTGIARAQQVFPDLVVIRYPLDFSWIVKRAFDRIRPTMVVLVELEVWYQFVTLATARGIPVAVVNGRLSERSVRRFGWVRWVVRRMFRDLAWVGAQDEAYAERFRRMGVRPERVAVTGSLKWDTAEVVDVLPGSKVLARAMGIDPQRPTWVCGSTGPGEEEVILRAYTVLRDLHPRLQLVIVPRKPERFDEVAAMITAAGFECVRRSQSPDETERQSADGEVMLGDTMGELRKFYTLANVVFVGRTLANMGGSDMMEVAALAKPVIVGPHTENFADTVRQLERGSAIRIVSVDLENASVTEALTDAVEQLLADPAAARRLAENGREVVLRNRGATERTLARLMEIARVRGSATGVARAAPASRPAGAA